MNDNLEKQTIDVDAVIEKIQQFTVETPTWGYGNSGTRFKVFPWQGAARTLREKLADTAEVQKVTGICPSVAIPAKMEIQEKRKKVQKPPPLLARARAPERMGCDELRRVKLAPPLRGHNIFSYIFPR